MVGLVYVHLWSPLPNNWTAVRFFCPFSHNLVRITRAHSCASIQRELLSPDCSEENPWFWKHLQCHIFFHSTNLTSLVFAYYQAKTPFWSMQSAARRRIFLTAFLRKLVLVRSWLNSFKIRVLKSSRLIGGVWKTCFKYPHKKKSNGVRSGDLGGHSWGVLRATTRFSSLWRSGFELQ